MFTLWEPKDEKETNRLKAIQLFTLQLETHRQLNPHAYSPYSPLSFVSNSPKILHT